MAGRDKDFSYKVSVDPAKGIQGLKDLQRAAKDNLGDVNDELDEGERNAKALAQAMRDAADKVEARIEKMATASEELGRALGPELAQQLGRNGVDKLVADMERAGLSLDDVEKNADELASGITRLKQAGEQVGSQVAGEFDAAADASARVGVETDKSRSVVANFAGNAAQDLPGVSGAFGALNVAVGQFAEYASEGDIKLANLAKSALGLGAATVAVGLIVKGFQKMAEIKAFDREQVESFVDALREGKDAVESMAEAFASAGKVEFRLFNHVEDATPALAEAGLTIEQFSKLVVGGKPAIEKYAAAMSEAGVEGEAIGKVILAAHDAAGKYEEAQKTAAIATQVFGEETEKAESSTHDLLTSQENAARAADRQREATEKLNDQIRDQTEATDDLFEVNYRLKEDYRDVISKTETYNQKLADGTATAEEREEAERDAAEAISQLAADTVKAAEAQATLNGNVLTEQEKNDIRIQKLGEVAAALAPGSELRKNLEDWIAGLSSVPTNVKTQMELDVVARVREAQNDLKDRQLQGRAHGGPVAAGTPYVVGEEGPELFVPGSSGAIVPNGRGSHPASTAGLTITGPVTVVTQATNGRELVDALIKWQRSGNPTPW